MMWNSSNNKVLIAFVILMIFFGVYKIFGIFIVHSMGASFGVGLGGMSGSQKTIEARKVDTDAPSQIIYRIDKNRFLTLENYISCDKGGQVYYNDTQRGIKTFVGFNNDFYDFSYSKGNSVSAYQGTIINGANNGYLAFPGASTQQYCGSGNSERGCPVFFYFSPDYGKTFIYNSIKDGYDTPKRFSKLKVVVNNNGVYLRDESEEEPLHDDYKRSYNDITRVIFYYYESGKLINIYNYWDKLVYKNIKSEIEKRKLSYADVYDQSFNIYSYAKTLKPVPTSDEINRMADELRDLIGKEEKKIYKNKIKLPIFSKMDRDDKYRCNMDERAKRITYISKDGRKEVIDHE